MLKKIILVAFMWSNTIKGNKISFILKWDINKELQINLNRNSEV